MINLKFRIWCKENFSNLEKNRMVYLNNHTVFDGQDLVFRENLETFWIDSSNSGDAEIMQFIGLKDKNGKDIYIGDILATSNTDETYDIWDKETYGYSVVEADKESLGFYFTNWNIDIEEDFDESVFSLIFVEVVGNIYENPELIKN